VIEPEVPWILDPERLRSRSKNTPFDGARFEGRVQRTLVAGRTVYEYADAKSLTEKGGE
jgi:dihydroorotase